MLGIGVAEEAPYQRFLIYCMLLFLMQENNSNFQKYTINFNII